MQTLRASQVNEITTIQNEGAAVLQVIERLVLTPDVSIEKIEKMLDLQERILNRNAHQAFTADLAAMQIELPLIAKNGKGHGTAKYALLEDINQAIRPALQKYGFAVTFRISQREKEVSITAVLSHKLGHSDETTITLPIDISGSKNATQAVGSTVSYGKRYAIGALLNISTGDDNDAASDSSERAISPGQIKTLKAIFDKLTEKNQEIFYNWLGEPKDVPAKMFNEAQAWLISAQKLEHGEQNAS